MTSKREHGLSCHKCYTSITVVGKDSDIAAALRRVDWTYEAGKATCRLCNGYAMTVSMEG